MHLLSLLAVANVAMAAQTTLVREPSAWTVELARDWNVCANGS